jgi:heme/copper-type cytochrome/quinol oxidase subunit 3
MRTGIWLLVSIVLAAAFEALEVRELFSLPFGWDNLPYGSIFWVMNGFQFLNVAAIILWTIPLTILAFGNRFDGRRRAGLEANRLYWNTALVWWVFFYLVLYYAPRVFAHVS